MTAAAAEALSPEEADAEALDAVENLLESYFVQIDGTFDKLEAIGAAAASHFHLPIVAALSCQKQSLPSESFERPYPRNQKDCFKRSCHSCSTPEV